jgi:hypothetical protein
MIIAFVMMQAQATTFSEAAAMLPTAGSVYDYLSCGLGRFWAITVTISAYFLVHVFAGTAETILSGIMALVNFESLNSAFEKHNSSWLVGVGLVVTFAITNIIGIKVFSKLEIVLTAGMWLSLMIFGILGLAAAPAVHLDGWFGGSEVGTSIPAVLSLVGMAMFMFVGCEFVTPLAPEMKAPGRTIPRAMALGLVGGALHSPYSSGTTKAPATAQAVVTTATDTGLDRPNPALLRPAVSAHSAVRPTTIAGPAANRVRTVTEDGPVQMTCVGENTPLGPAGAGNEGCSAGTDGTSSIYLTPHLPDNPTGVREIGVETDKVSCDELPSTPVTTCTPSPSTGGSR